ncbi:MAG: ribose 5-phosphate isomerase B [Stygiobacter sp.]|jgi:ribose 5-phosphate isomerase B|uniref:Ribose 5-phosphate isomerase B n=1 Tax=Stygiobacter electus TaxID=3032292 RepID=A0AAE3P0Y9_9BACT|nr:ribose 5-phosphate isomerase B [Stygiobacter electus]MDF1612387.1 ribose 5-phosphate isomerase B [Stygiobacter electus]
MKKLITEDYVLQVIKKGEKEIFISKDFVLTPLALDRIKSEGLKIVNQFSENKNENKFNKIIIGSDHTGVKAKKLLVEYLKKKNYELTDIGTFTEDSVDYPDIAIQIAKTVRTGEYDCGIILDATGIPSAITANKFPGIRAATCYNEFSARSSREHNNANILVLGAKTLGDETIKSIVDVWLNTNFLGERHQRRLDKIKALEESLNKN